MQKGKEANGGTVKVVINDRYGGFGLSLLAQKRYLELKGKEAFFFKCEEGGTYTPISIEEHNRRWGAFIMTFTINNPGDYKEIDEICFLDEDIDRDDETLIQVVEELGEEANSFSSRLKIIEIPDDVKWYVEENDGLEHVAEVHRTWS